MATTSALARNNPFQELETMRRMMDRMWAWPSTTAFTEGMIDNLPLDMYDQGNKLIIKAALPGVRSDDVSVTFDSGVLTIKGKTTQDKEIKDDDYHLREYTYSHYSRSVRLPVDCDADSIKAQFHDGMLKLTIPRKASKNVRRIEVEAK